jgi:hypothetical protein
MKPVKNQKSPKLALPRETLVVLTGRQLAAVRGADDVEITHPQSAICVNPD